MKVNLEFQGSILSRFDHGHRRCITSAHIYLIYMYDLNRKVFKLTVDSFSISESEAPSEASPIS